MDVHCNHHPSHYCSDHRSRCTEAMADQERGLALFQSVLYKYEEKRKRRKEGREREREY